MGFKILYCEYFLGYSPQEIMHVISIYYVTQGVENILIFVCFYNWVEIQCFIFSPSISMPFLKNVDFLSQKYITTWDQLVAIV